MPGKKSLQASMVSHDIPGISKATLIDGKIDYQTLGTTSCGFFKKALKPEEPEYSQYDSSRYILTDSALYFYDIERNQLSIVKTEGLQRANLEKYFSKDLNYQKFKEIPALKQEQLHYLNQRFGQQFQPVPIDEKTQFGAASLSKPVFSYLVLKIIEDKDIQKELGLTDFSLDTKLVDLLPDFAANSPLAKDVTVGMVLSHQTGIHDPTQGNDAPEIVFQPGTAFGYAGFPLFYLQMALEKETKQTLQQLAQTYVFTPCRMDNSTFLKKNFEDKHRLPKDLKVVFPQEPSEFSSVAANSLRTTAEDYAKFMMFWMQDKKLRKYLTTPVVKMEKDGWANQLVDKTQLKQLAWAHGVGLQLDANGEVNAVFHNGDMNQWRAILAINPQTQTGTVFFTNSHNGDVLAQDLIQDVIEATSALTYMRDKFGFAIADEPEWEAKQYERLSRADQVIAKQSIEAAKRNLDRANQKLEVAIKTNSGLPTAKLAVKMAEEGVQKAGEWDKKLLTPKPDPIDSTSKMLHGLSDTPPLPKSEPTEEKKSQSAPPLATRGVKEAIAEREDPAHISKPSGMM